MPLKIHSLIVWLKSDMALGAIVHRDQPDGSLRPINSKRAWLTAKAGDAVLVAEQDSSQRYFIESIELYLVDPDSANGLKVATAAEWLKRGEHA